MTAIEEELVAEADMEELAASLTDALFTAVGVTDVKDKALRRAVLQLKREVFAGMAPTLSADALTNIAAVLPEPAAATLGRWSAAAARRLDARCRAEDLLTGEIANRIRPALRAPLVDPLFRDALAMASPSIALHALRDEVHSARIRPDQFERSLLSYLIRAAAKTSPFSSFMATAVIPFGDTDAPLRLDALRTGTRVRLNRGLLTWLFKAVLPQLPPDRVMLRLNASFGGLGQGRFGALVSRFQTQLGRPWRQLSLSHFRLAPTVSAVLLGQPEPATKTIWIRRFMEAGIGADQAARLPDRLVERDILQADGPLDDFGEEPEGDLARMLRAIGGGVADAFAEPLEDAARNCATLRASQDEPQARIRRLAQVGEQLSALSRSQAGEQELGLKNLILEDCWALGQGGAVPLRHAEALKELSEFLSSEVAVSAHHAVLRDTFVERFGSNGELRAPLDFLVEAQALLSRNVEYGAAATVRPSEYAPDGAGLPLTVQLQLIDGPEGDAKAPLAAVNKVYEGAGWLAARHGFGATDDHRRARDGLAAWLQTVAGDAEPVDLTVCGDCNDLQAHPKVTERVLAWPGAALRADEPGMLDLQTLRLVHHRQSRSLRLLDCDGRRIQLFQLGSSLPNPTWGVGYALTVLSRPYELMRPAFSPPADAAEGNVSLVPRVTAGRIVVKRAIWWVRTAYLKRAWLAERGAARLRAVRRDRERLGLPSTFFSRRPVQDSSAIIGRNALETKRKPLWIDLANPFCLDLLERQLEGVDWIAFTEALPGPDEHALTIGGRRHVSELQVELLVRAAGR